MIPKTIHQCMFGPMRNPSGELHVLLQKQIEETLKLNPNYCHKIYDDIEMKNFIKNNYDDRINRAYDMLKIGASKADLWRYLLLYKEGGIYLDIDSIITGSLDVLIKDRNKAVISREGIPGRFVQWCLIMPPNHGIMKEVIELCVSNIETNIAMDVSELTGPVVYSTAIQNHLKLNNVYDMTDEEVNSNSNNTDVYLYSIDYVNFAHYWSPHKHIFHTSQFVHWTTEQKVLYGL